MKNIVCFCYLGIIFFIQPLGISAQVDLNNEVVTTSVEYTLPSGIGNTPENFGPSLINQICSYKGYTYLAFIDKNQYPRVAKIKDGEAQIEFLAGTYKSRANDGHHKFALGIDRDGYIHISGDMHHHPFDNNQHINSSYYRNSSCLYWKSDNPEDISSFTFYGNDPEYVIPGIGFTYVTFKRDNEGTLYVTSRQWVRNDTYWSGNPGKLALGLARYNADTKKWKALGGIAPIDPVQDGWDPNNNKVIFWEPTGKGNTPYQTWGNDIHFDKDNNIHLATAMNTDNSSNGSNPGSGTAVCYAYSTDKGETWYKADGSQIEQLPLRAITTDLVAKGHWYMMEAGMTLTKEENPLVMYRTHDGSTTQSYWREFRDSKWLPEIKLNNTYRRGRPVVDKNGIITVHAHNNLFRTLDYSSTGREYDLDYDVYALDFGYFSTTGGFRYVSKVNDALALVRVDISGTTSRTDIMLNTGYEMKLNQSFPNPANKNINITYSIPEGGLVKLKVINILGKEIKSLVNEYQTAGKYEVMFETETLPAGIYPYVMEINGFRLCRSMVVSK